MCKFNPKNGGRRIDPCMKNLIKFIGEHSPNHIEVVACCCGHFKYPMTIIVKYASGDIFDLMSNKRIPREKRFYKRDKQGFYFIPETIKEKK